MHIVAVLVFVALLASSCGGEEGEEPAAQEEAGGEATEAEEPAGVERWQKVPNGVVKAIQTGLTVEGGGKLRSAQAVKSGDFESVYFVSADIQGPGLEGAHDIGTWATNRLRVGGLIFAVDSVAKEFSDWGHGDKTDARLSMEDDGAEESQECALGRPG